MAKFLATIFFTIANIQLKMKRCLLLPFDFFKPVLGTRYKPCYSILTLFLKNSQDYVVMTSHFGQKSQINHQTCFSTLARLHLWIPLPTYSFLYFHPRFCLFPLYCSFYLCFPFAYLFSILCFILISFFLKGGFIKLTLFTSDPH